MNAWLRLVGVIDAASEAVAKVVRWALLANALLITGNAFARKLFSIAMPVIYDLQWHFFGAVVLLMAAYTLKRDEHVRVDVLAQRFGDRGMAWLDLIGITLVLLPLCLVMVWVTTPAVISSLFSGETRANRESVTNLPVWIIKSFIPAGFALLAMQGVAEAIRCVAHLKGLIPRPVNRHQLIEGGELGR